MVCNGKKIRSEERIMVLRGGEIFINIPTFSLPVYPNSSFLCSYHTFLFHVHEFRRIVTELRKCLMRDSFKKINEKENGVFITYKYLFDVFPLYKILHNRFCDIYIHISILVDGLSTVAALTHKTTPVVFCQKKKKNQSTKRHQTIIIISLRGI